MHKNEARPVAGVSGEEEEASWLNWIPEIERKEERLLDLCLEGDITAEQFCAKSTAFQENREAARLRLSRREDFERDKEALLEYHARLVPEDLDRLAFEQRHTLYRMMRLNVLAHDGELIAVDWGCNASSTLPGSFRTRGR